jgi:hypothetical protein
MTTSLDREYSQVVSGYLSSMSADVVIVALVTHPSRKYNKRRAKKTF